MKVTYHTYGIIFFIFRNLITFNIDQSFSSIIILTIIEGINNNKNIKKVT